MLKRHAPADRPTHQAQRHAWRSSTTPGSTPHPRAGNANLKRHSDFKAGALTLAGLQRAAEAYGDECAARRLHSRAGHALDAVWGLEDDDEEDEAAEEEEEEAEAFRWVRDASGWGQKAKGRQCSSWTPKTPHRPQPAGDEAALEDEGELAIDGLSQQWLPGGRKE